MAPSGSTLARRFPQRATRWTLRTRTLELPWRPLLMGIVNVTPDSFSDGGQFLATSAAVDHALQLAADGADIIDIGGESTRPHADPISLDEELRRVLPVVEAVCQQVDLPVSIDTFKARVATEAIDMGTEIINDVTGLEGDPAMVGVAVDSGTGVCALHMQGTPKTMQDDPTYDDVVQDVYQYLAKRREALLSAGVKRSRICLDPGIGFGKTHQHNIELLAQCGRFHPLECPLLVGHSRKGFIGKVLGDQDSNRTSGTIGVALALARQGVQVLRVHDVKPVREALQLYSATGGIDGETIQLE